MSKREESGVTKTQSKKERKRGGINRLVKGDPGVFLKRLKSDTGQKGLEFVYKENADGPYETIAVEGEEIDMGWRPFIDNIPQAVLNNHCARIRSRIDKLLEKSNPKSKSKKPRKTSIKKQRISKAKTNS